MPSYNQQTMGKRLSAVPPMPPVVFQWNHHIMRSSIKQPQGWMGPIKANHLPFFVQHFVLHYLNVDLLFLRNLNWLIASTLCIWHGLKHMKDYLSNFFILISPSYKDSFVLFINSLNADENWVNWKRTFC